MGDDTDEQRSVEATPADRSADAAAIAAEIGESLDEVVAGLEHQDRFDELLVHVRETYGDVYAGAWTEGFPRSSSTISVTGAVPAGLTALAAASGLRVAVVGGSQRSWEQLEDLGRVVAEGLRRRGFTGAVTAVSAKHGRIEVTVPAGGTGAGTAADVAARSAILEVLAARSPADVGIVARGGLVVELGQPGRPVGAGEHTYGGGSALDGATRECTTAFTVDMAGGDTGVLTAAHCAGIDRYRQEDGLAYAMPWVDEHVGVHGDLELHSSTHPEPDDFYADFGALRDVTGIAAIGAFNEGDFLCVFGRTSGRDCTTIHRLWICYFPDAREACNVVAMTEHVTAGGDSGGPWYLNNTAWGVHSGVATVGGIARSVFTPVFWVDNEFGATIRR